MTPGRPLDAVAQLRTVPKHLPDQHTVGTIAEGSAATCSCTRVLLLAASVTLGFPATPCPAWSYSAHQTWFLTPVTTSWCDASVDHGQAQPAAAAN